MNEIKGIGNANFVENGKFIGKTIFEETLSARIEEIYLTSREVARRWLGYTGRKVAFWFPPNARVARLLTVTIPSPSQNLHKSPFILLINSLLHAGQSVRQYTLVLSTESQTK